MGTKPTIALVLRSVFVSLFVTVTATTTVNGAEITKQGVITPSKRPVSPSRGAPSTPPPAANTWHRIEDLGPARFEKQTFYFEEADCIHRFSLAPAGAQYNCNIPYDPAMWLSGWEIVTFKPEKRYTEGNCNVYITLGATSLFANTSFRKGSIELSRPEAFECYRQAYRHFRLNEEPLYRYVLRTAP